MKQDELNLWARYRQGDESSREELILLYLPLAIVWATRVAKMAGWANLEDLKQEGIIGLMKAIERFDVSRGVPFKYFARQYIRGAIFHSSELTRNLARHQEEVYRQVRQTVEELTRDLQRIPTIEEVSERTDLSIEQIQNAVDAMGVAFAEELPDAEGGPDALRILTPSPERTIMLFEALAHLCARDLEIIRLYYWEDVSHEGIAQKLGLKDTNVIKIRQRAIKKLVKVLDIKK